ncbi:MAG: PhnD/SsuA/transferrin family substrate-binding protein [SAR324 cluster bacterium]|nr:PhnD/SsuA/transferrin family substrate-binding protein [SAR324 cluster bacterium]MBL7035313.1 PhnD/SsuA/transferrin family substrate-binding protein [SAR324 cluster bacterium]
MELLHATLPLYDLPEAQMQCKPYSGPCTDAFWQGLAESFRKAGLENVPDILYRGDDVYQNNVFFGQVCGYPLTHEFSGRFQVIATPVYRTPYFTGPEYRSVIVVHKNCEWEKLADANGSLAAVNSKNSHSGYNILRYMVTQLTTGPYEVRRLTKPFFSGVLISGGHRNSLSQISNKEADVAAIDALTWSLLERYVPKDLENVRILEISPPAPAPAFVTENSISTHKLNLFRKAIQTFFDEQNFNTVCEQLFLDSIEILPEDAYACILEMENNSIEEL